MTFTPEQKAERAKARRAETKRKAEAERLHRIHLAFPWKRKTEGAGIAELDRLFSGAKGVTAAQKATGHAGSKRHPTRPAERRQILVKRLAARMTARSVIDRSMKREGGLGAADRVMNYTGGHDASKLTGPQRRRVNKKLNHALAAHRAGKDKRPAMPDLELAAVMADKRQQQETRIYRPGVTTEPIRVNLSRGAIKAAARARGGRRGA
jgi:hypothetical protein